MKLKDIKVGEEYAIGAPNSHYEKFRRVRGRVVKVGVHGTVSVEYSTGMSARANYVEFEIVKDERAWPPGWSNKHRIVEDPRTRFGERPPERYGEEKGEIKDVLRCLGTHVLMPWSEFLGGLVEHDEREAQDKITGKARKAEAADIRERFKKMGYEAGGFGNRCFEFSVEDAEKLLIALERKR